jgi:hypothetical protein
MPGSAKPSVHAGRRQWWAAVGWCYQTANRRHLHQHHNSRSRLQPPRHCTCMWYCNKCAGMQLAWLACRGSCTASSDWLYRLLSPLTCKCHLAHQRPLVLPHPLILPPLSTRSACLSGRSMRCDCCTAGSAWHQVAYGTCYCRGQVQQIVR